MKISVILPCYNAERYLNACFESLFAQSMRDFEVIFIDDGSLDGSLVIARRCAGRDDRIRVFAQENQGVSAARNLGLSHARGEWITFVDGDDILPPDALETLLSGAAEDVDMVVCPHETFDERGHARRVWPETRWYRQNGEQKKNAAVLRLIEGDCVLNIMCGKLIRRALIEREHIRLVSGVKMAEDALFNLETVLCARNIAYVHHVAYRYRIHSASATGSRRNSEWEAHLPWLVAMRNMLARRGELERYYAPLLNSFALRLYKDGGIRGVVREFNTKVKPYLALDGLTRAKMTPYGRVVWALCRRGRYPTAYPLIAVVQMMKRKCGEAAFALRAEREKPQ